MNLSEDILGWCTEALGRLAIPWRRSNRDPISVSTPPGVALLDELVGPKC